ncbi:cytochrome P450 [Sinorhizobium americanum]|uniref:Cytochrome P450 n=1 Tax=Sinorhizobium americanum TaxID=194963 RepID=A0A4R2AMR2_9HYPH|nr:cytochrome P450 [Sinorhizobium americanum]TCN14867.1 cytochrome P450 [Sinorhizobium americanum]
MSKLEEIPQPKGLPVLGHITSINPNAPVQSLIRLSKEFGPIFRLQTFGRNVIIVGNRELTAELCDETRFCKALHPPLAELRKIGNDGLFTADNNESNWGKAHRLLTPAFGPLGLNSMFSKMVDVVDQMLLRWERFGSDAEIDVADNMTRLALDTIALCAFNHRFNSFYRNERNSFVTAMEGALKEVSRRALFPPGASKLMFLRNRRFKAHTRTLRALADDLIDKRRLDARLGERSDLLDIMLTTKDKETGEMLSRENIGYQMITFLIAGHETTSGLLSFATWLLLKNPEELSRLQAHVDEALGGEPPTAQDLGKLDCVEQALMETLRLWPTAPGFAVRPTEDAILAGRYRLTPNDILLILLPVLHRDPGVWDEPDVFRPARFKFDHAKEALQHAWKPFGNGQRACLGRGFAMQEAVLVMAMMLQRFYISLVDDSYELVVGETLTMKPIGLRIRAKRRHWSAGMPRRSAPAASKEQVLRRVPRSIADRGPVLILYGSNTGMSESFAKRIGSEAATRGYAPVVAPADDYSFGLPVDIPFIVVAASYEGLPPNNARRFLAWAESLPPDTLAGRPFAVFGCGNRHWAQTWQAVPKRLEAALARAGAVPVAKRGEADAGGDVLTSLDAWSADLWEALAAAV